MAFWMNPMSKPDDSWVIYQVAVPGEMIGPNAVCKIDEWDAMERDRPGLHRLIQSGIESEGVAERLRAGNGWGH